MMNRPLGLAITGLGIALAVAAGLWASGFVVDRDGTAQAPVRTSGTALVGGPFELVDHTGAPVTNADFRGRHMLIFFGFTYCPDVCPTELQVMSAALDRLGDEAEAVQPLFITVDPERDTPAAMAGYIRHFHPSLRGLSGTPDQIDAVAKAYRVYYRKVQDGSSATDYLMDHSAVVYLMGPDGTFLTHFAPGTGPDEMADKIATYLAG